ncbi:1-deoxy-D-xylulose-5-phosphate reductoisomerase [Marinomonas agarivorans]|nr:1-deoxy-D-xylulose-5-phosphate reductoisomerase [Marinomonas agarivorans]
MKQNICILGATGSIGTSTLDVIRQHEERFSVFAVAAHSNVERMVQICHQFQPARVVMGTESACEQVKNQCLGMDIEFTYGIEAMSNIAADPQVDQVMAAIMGFAGLAPTLAAIRTGKRILLANKESLVTAGSLFMQEVEKHGAVLLPIDSEHNAIYQCLPQFTEGARGEMLHHVEKVLLTASGGPFRELSKREMSHVTPEQACKHPNWSMGRKISVDSASLMNKGLELIEACWLFDVEPKDIEVVIHPQSIVHSMVSYKDGSVLAQMGNPDMRTPIAYGMAWPERITADVAPLDLMAIAQLDFFAPDYERFPNLSLAADAWYAGGSAMASLNAANEIAVDAFLKGQIGFLDIAEINSQVLEQSEIYSVTGLDVVFEADKIARKAANDLVKHKVYL